MNRFTGTEIIFVTGPPGAGKTSMAIQYKNENQHVEQFGNGDFMRDLRTGRVGYEYSDIVQRAVKNSELLPDSVFSGAVYEKVLQSSDDTKLLFITGFPYAHGDWGHFFERIQNTDRVKAVGAVALYASMQTCVDRMQRRDVNNGVGSSEVYTEQAAAVYRERYLAHLARSATRLDCFLQSEIEIATISAEEPIDSVFDNFTYAVNNFIG